VLYRAEAFEPLVEEPWDDARVRDGIAAVVADADAHFDPAGLWPANEWDAWKSQPPLKDLYCGAGGVVWALDALRRRGHAETQVDLAAAIVRTLELWRERPDLSELDALPQPRQPALLAGEGGLLLVAWRLAPGARLADALLARVRANVANEAQELMWGAPGTMLAAQAMHAWTGEPRWAEAREESARALLTRRDADGLWTQRLHGPEPLRYLGPAHGFVGVVHALLQLDAEWSDGLRRDAAAVLVDAAVVEDELANWPPFAGEGLENARGEIRLQWCHGAPGIVATAAPYLDEELLLAGAELTWRAGAHGADKGPGLCHGTAGNGYALLKAFARTRDERWLERARRFAVHALAQAERARAEQGRGRYSLWTGDVGVALFAADCLDGTPRYPILDGWE
jgi:lantibiotic modifying enzyme